MSSFTYFEISTEIGTLRHKDILYSIDDKGCSSERYQVPLRLAVYFSHFAFHECFLRNISRNTKHSLYTFCISCEFLVLLMLWKNKPQSPLSFRVNADPGAKCKKWKKRRKMRKSGTEYPTIHFSFFVFRAHFLVFCDKCIAGLRRTTLVVYWIEYTLVYPFYWKSQNSLSWLWLFSKLGFKL